MHEQMVKELFDNKSLKALEYLIDQGRELEFEYSDITCFISKDNSKRYVSVWVEKDEQAFDFYGYNLSLFLNKKVYLPFG